MTKKKTTTSKKATTTKKGGSTKKPAGEVKNNKHQAKINRFLVICPLTMTAQNVINGAKDFFGDEFDKSEVKDGKVKITLKSGESFERSGL
jgi:hypothetical protein